MIETKVVLYQSMTELCHIILSHNFIGVKTVSRKFDQFIDISTISSHQVLT